MDTNFPTEYGSIRLDRVHLLFLSPSLLSTSYLSTPMASLQPFPITDSSNDAPTAPLGAKEFGLETPELSPVSQDIESEDSMQTALCEREHGPVSIHVDSGSETDTENEALAAAEAQRAHRRSSSRVTFRSRVRITSGLRQHRFGISKPIATSNGIPNYSPASSRSCSPSSSISAPLRFHSEEAGVKPGWGTLGQRVSLLAQRNAQKKLERKKAKALQRSLAEPCFAGLQRSESTPLLGAAGGFYGATYTCECPKCQAEQEQEEWPSRLFDPRWWWTSIRNAMTCKCLDDSDEEGVAG